MSQIDATNRIVRTIRDYSLTYRQFLECCNRARKTCKLTKPAVPFTLPKLPSEDEVTAILKTIDNMQNIRNLVMLKLLFYTGVRVSELSRLRVKDFDLTGCTIFIEKGKRQKDRIVPLAQNLVPTLKLYFHHLGPGLRTWNIEGYLFSVTARPLTTRRIQQIVNQLRIDANIPTHLTPHKFRHMLLTYLRKQGIPLDKIMIISGHEDIKTAKIYSHLAVGDISEEFQTAVKKI